MDATRQPDFTNQTLYVGIDVHKRSWAVSVHTGDFEYKTFTQPADPRILANYLRRTFPGGTYLAAYEAGYAGFWIHDELVGMGVNCVVIHAADVPVKDKEKRHKSDPRDCRRIARGLRSGELEPIYVPSVTAREDRALVRRRSSIIKEITRTKNRIKSLLQFHGISIPSVYKSRNWSGRFIRWLETVNLATESGQESLSSLLRQFAYYRDEEATISRKIRALARTDRYKNPVKYLTSIPGVGIISAMIWLTEIVDIHRFQSFDRLTSYVGLVPWEHSSGERTMTAGLDSRGNRRLRTLLIENSWAAMRKDPGLMSAYYELTKRMHGNKAIIRIARKLLTRIRYVLIHETAYEMGLA